MKLFYIGKFELPHRTENYVTYALQKRDVTVRQYQCGTEQSPTDLIQSIKEFDPEVVLFSKAEPKGCLAILDYCRSKKITTVCWQWDLYWGHRRKMPAQFRADLLLTTDGGHPNEFRNYGCNHYVLRQGIHKPEWTRRTRSPQDQIFPLAFVGGALGHANRRRLLAWLTATYGSKLRHHTSTRGLDLNNSLAKTKIVVGDTHPSPYYWSNRIYEIIGRGGFLLHPETEGLDQDFTAGEHYIPFRHKRGYSELQRAIEYWLNHDEEREQIRKAGWEHCGKYHTYGKRVDVLLDVIERFRNSWPMPTDLNAVSKRKPDETPTLRPVSTIAPKCEVKRLAVLTCHFNPCNYRKPKENFSVFQQTMADLGADLWVADLAFDDAPHDLESLINPGVHYFQYRGTTERNLVWQKERLLNLLVAQLPEDVDGIAWVDADIVPTNPHWIADTCRALENYRVVQLFENAYEKRPSGLTFLKPSSAFWYSLGNPEFRNLGKTHPGFAWAGRADWLRKIGLCDHHVTGGGDTLMVRAFTKTRLLVEQHLGKSWREHYSKWVEKAHTEVNRSIGVVPGEVHHLWHGSFKDRKYVQRWGYQTKYGFNPATDLELAPNGIWQWTSHALATKPEMVSLVANYFTERKEDNEP